jgi:malate dehydrogenase (quinone)
MTVKQTDVLLIGGGVMSATLGTMIKHLDPSLHITMLERLDKVAHESTEGWNNAGTGHSGYCELNYTPQMPDGSVEVKRALEINASFEESLQFWSYLVKKGDLPEPNKFIHSAPHESFVWNKDGVAYLRARYEELKKHPLFETMEFTDDPEQLKEWMPLVMEGRDASEPVAATRVKQGTDVDFGALTKAMVSKLADTDGFSLLLKHHVKRLKKTREGNWRVVAHDDASDQKVIIDAKFVFIGAGGGTLPLLQKTQLPESKGYGGFPVSGLWLVCRNPEVVAKHHAKVYGKAAIGAPPMSVPHLDIRTIEGEKALLFGPFAGFTTKFLNEGTYFDLISSVTLDNFKSLIQAGMTNFALTKYLISESRQSFEDRMKSLKGYYPEANSKDWTLQEAGKRVQIIKTDEKGNGKLEFGTEIVASKDGSLAALLGASPGASTSISAMLEVLESCLDGRLLKDGWKDQMKEMIPTYGQSLIGNRELIRKIRPVTLSTLNLNGLDD